MVDTKIGTLVHPDHMDDISTHLISAHIFGAAYAACFPNFPNLKLPRDHQPKVISALIALFRLLSDDHFFFSCSSLENNVTTLPLMPYYQISANEGQDQLQDSRENPDELAAMQTLVSLEQIHSKKSGKYVDEK